MKDPMEALFEELEKVKAEFANDNELLRQLNSLSSPNKNANESAKSKAKNWKN